MLEDTPVCADCFQCCFEASVVLTSFVTPSCFDQSGEAAPSRAGWVGDYGVGACVEACISVLVPRIDTIEPVVGAVRLHIQGRNGHRASLQAHNTPSNHARFAQCDPVATQIVASSS